MTSTTVYIYVTIKPNGKKRRTCSLIEDDTLGTLEKRLTRLVADPGKVLTDGRTITSCIDTTTPEQWSEIDEPTPEPEPEPEVNDEEE